MKRVIIEADSTVPVSDVAQFVSSNPVRFLQSCLFCRSSHIYPGNKMPEYSLSDYDLSIVADRMLRNESSRLTAFKRETCFSHASFLCGLISILINLIQS